MQRTENPLVSIIIPTYSRPDNLLRAIQSVLDQTYNPIEIIIVDDNGIGTPYQLETEAKLHHLLIAGKITYLKHETNKNGSAARNTGFKASKGDYVNFLDDDDVFEPTKVEKQVARLSECGSIYDACYCNSILYNPRRIIHTHNTKEGDLCYDLLIGKVFFNTSTILFKRQALSDINGWDERFIRHQDWELLVRYFRKHKICIVDKKNYLVKKYASPNVITKNPKRAIEYRQFFLNEMKCDIDKYPKSKKIYRAQMEDLALILLASGAKKEGRKQFKRIFKYGYPSFIGIGKYIYYLLFN